MLLVAKSAQRMTHQFNALAFQKILYLSRSVRARIFLMKSYAPLLLFFQISPAIFSKYIVVYHSELTALGCCNTTVTSWLKNAKEQAVNFSDVHFLNLFMLDFARLGRRIQSIAVLLQSHTHTSMNRNWDRFDSLWCTLNTFWQYFFVPIDKSLSWSFDRLMQDQMLTNLF